MKRITKEEMNEDDIIQEIDKTGGKVYFQQSKESLLA